MNNRRLSSDAVEWAYDRYIKGHPEREASLGEASRQSDLAQRIYDIRERFRMSREDLAEFSGLTVETIEDMEESDYDGDWDQAVKRLDAGFRKWFANVILPASKMKPEDYSVGPSENKQVLEPASEMP
jgi:DNA-binding XRE family transcriptional regulator